MSFEFERNESIYENYVCTQCLHQVLECTCETYPRYNLLWIDKNIQEHVRILNDKGYITNYSCESHAPNDIIYINFSGKYGLGETIQIPEGFKHVKSYNQIEHWYGKDSKARKKMAQEEFEAEKKRHLDILLGWCKSLPEYNPNKK